MQFPALCATACSLVSPPPSCCFSSPMRRCCQSWPGYWQGGPRNGGLGAINMYSRAAIRRRSHRTVDRSEAQNWGRRPLLLLTFFALSARGAIFAVTSDPYLLIAAQLLDGISAASLGVLVPLIVADVTRGSGHFNFAQGMIGAAVGIGASFSTTLAGFIVVLPGPQLLSCHLHASA